MPDTKAYESILLENAALQARMAELEETLRAIRSAEVDALVVPTQEGNKLFLMQSTDDAYRLLVEEMQEAAVTVSMDGTIIYCNRRFAQISNYNGDQLLSRSIHQFLVPKAREKFHVFLQTASNQSGIRGEFSLLSQDQQTIPVLVAANLLDLKQVRLICLIITDLTEIKRLEASLIEQEKLQTALDKERELNLLKSHMMERITHEFRTPLTIIQISTETLIHYIDRLTPEQRIAKFKTIQQTNSHLAEMLDEISMVVKNNIAPSHFKMAPFKMNQLIQAAILEIETRFDVLNKFMLEIPHNTNTTVMGDRDILKLALLHIFRNAVHFSPPDSVVTICVSSHKNTIEIAVMDKGIGILPNEQAHIFDPFFRGTNINEVSGLGLGLTIALSAIQAHHGTITVESVPQQGSTFKLLLPA